MTTGVVFLTESPLSQRDYRRFGIELLRESFDVRILDCTAWLKPSFWETHKTVAFECEGYRSIRSASEFTRALGDLRNIAVIDLIGGSPECNRARREIQKRGGRLIVLLAGFRALPPDTSTGMRAWRTRLGNSAVAAEFKYFCAGLGLTDRWGPKPDTVVLTGTAGLSLRGIATIRRRIAAHSFDFDTYLYSRQAGRGNVEPFAVFLDADLPYHSDWLHSNLKPPVTPSAYFSSMNRFFAEFERKTGLPVVIAAHPRADYAARPDSWEHRIPVSGQTCDLVRDAEVVLLHDSAALSFAVLWRKPMIVLTTAELAVSFMQPVLDYHAALLHADVVNVDAAAAMPDPRRLAVDEKAYAAYQFGYIKMPGTLDDLLWAIVANSLKG